MRGRSPVLLVAALAPASVLAVDPWGWYPFGPIKWLAVTLLVTAGSLVVLARRPSRFSVAPTVVALSLVAWLAVAAVAGADPIYAWVGTPERHLGVLAWALAVLALVVGQSLDGDRDRRVVAGGLVVAGLGVGAIAVAEALGWEPDALDTGTRLSGTLGSPAYLGAGAALLLPALVGVAADGTWARRTRAAATAGAVGLAVALVGSGARAAWVGLAVAGVVTAWVHRARLGRRPRVVLLAVASAGVATAALVIVGPVGERVASTFDAGEPGGAGRVDEWRVAGRVIADHPFVGVGPEGYRVAFGDRADAAYEQEHGRDPLPDRAHSTPLDVALAGGLPALAAWLALVVLVGRAALVALRGDRVWLAGIAAGLVAHTVGGLFLFPVVELEPVVWLLAGLVLGAAPTTARVVGALIVERPTPRPVLVVVGLAAVVALVAGAADVAADRHARRAADALARGDGATAADEARAATRLRPDEVRLRLLEARARVADDQGIVAGLAAVDDALAISPGDPIARREWARLLVARAEATRAPDHIARARAEIDRLLTDDPVSSTLWALASVAAALDGDEDVADEALRRAEELRPEARDGT